MCKNRCQIHSLKNKYFSKQYTMINIYTACISDPAVHFNN